MFGTGGHAKDAFSRRGLLSKFETSWEEKVERKSLQEWGSEGIIAESGSFGKQERMSS